MKETLLAAIDMGTNSFHLVIVKTLEDGRFEIIGKEKEMVRLGSGAGDMDNITPEAMTRGVEALQRFKRIADPLGAPLRAVATSAVREAKNQKEFLDRVKKEVGINVEVIPGTEEARLIYLGVIQALPIFEKRVLVVDIGGGSTEFVIGHRGLPQFAVSSKLGAIRLTDHFFRKEPVTENDVEECRRYVRVVLGGFLNRLRAEPFETGIGSSGTIETLIQIKKATRPTGDGETDLEDPFLTDVELKKIVELLIKEPTAERRARLPGLDAKRADIIIAGAVLLDEIFQALSIKKMHLSPFALREGVILDSINRLEQDENSRFHDIRTTSVERIASRFLENRPPEMDSSRRISGFAGKLFQDILAISPDLGLTEKDGELLEYAGLLHNTGMAVSHSSHHKHSYYIVKNSDGLLGFSKMEREVIALLCRYHRKSSPSRKHSEYAFLPDLEARKVRLLAIILRMAIALDRGRIGNIQDVSLAKIQSHQWKLQVYPAPVRDISLEIWAAGLRKEEFEKTFQCKLTIERA